MRAVLLALACLGAWPGTPHADAGRYVPPRRVGTTPAAAQVDTSARAFVSLLSGRDENQRDINLLSLNVTNYGFIGNNFSARTPSMEYPVGSGHDHLVRGGLWVGAIAVDQNGVFTGVSCGAIDGSINDGATSSTEFGPIGDIIDVRSSLINSRKYTPAAVSERDLVSHFDDRTPKRTLNNNEDHRPLGIEVRQENYSWSFSDYRHMVFFHWVIKNTGAPLRNAYVGIYNELASGNKNNYNNFPTGIGSWFGKKQVGWIDSLSLFTERYCESGPIPQNCFYSKAPEIVGVKLLGIRPGTAQDPDKALAMHCWDWQPGESSRDEDVERYALMGSGTKTDLDPLPAELTPGSGGGDPAELLAIGPFFQVNPGDSIEVDFVFIGGLNEAEMIKRSRTAQRAYDLDYLVPVPPPSPRFKAITRTGAIDFYWDDSPEAFLDPTSPQPRDFEGYRLHVGTDRNDLRRVAQFDLATAPNDTTGFNTGLDGPRLAAPVVIDGVTYHYKFTLDNLRDGFKYFTAVTAYDLGNTEIESLESGVDQNESMVVPAPRVGERSGGVVVFPNPYRVEAAWDAGRNVRDHYLWFANLPARCALRIYTLAGDLVYEADFDGATYDGRNARGIYDPARDLPGTFSGATFGWDLVTRRGQAAATGLYLWSVEDLANGKTQVGKVLLVKSDREGLQ
jgi:hypothetical protein